MTSRLTVTSERRVRRQIEDAERAGMLEDVALYTDTDLERLRGLLRGEAITDEEMRKLDISNWSRTRDD